MSSELAHFVRTDDDYTYTGVQAKLRNFERAMDIVLNTLESGCSRMRINSAKAQLISGFIYNAGLDTQFIALTIEAGEDLADADRDMAGIRERVRNLRDKARAIRRRHAHLYGALDEARSGRRYRTPNPSFFETD